MIFAWRSYNGKVFPEKYRAPSEIGKGTEAPVVFAVMLPKNEEALSLDKLSLLYPCSERKRHEIR